MPLFLLHKRRVAGSCRKEHRPVATAYKSFTWIASRRPQNKLKALDKDPQDINFYCLLQIINVAANLKQLYERIPFLT